MTGLRRLVVALRNELQIAAGQYSAVTDVQRNRWMALVQKADAALKKGSK